MMAQSRKTNEPELPFARRNWAAPIAQDSRAAAQTALVRAGFADPAILLHWDEIAGADTARLARPIRLTEGPSGGVLTLKSEPGAALFLHHESRALTERINAYLGRPAVARLRFVQGPIAKRQIQPPRHLRLAPVPVGDPAQAFKGPESVRAALLKLAQARLRKSR
jgi:hypothetical protein